MASGHQGVARFENKEPIQTLQPQLKLNRKTMLKREPLLIDFAFYSAWNQRNQSRQCHEDDYNQPDELDMAEPDIWRIAVLEVLMVVKWLDWGILNIPQRCRAGKSGLILGRKKYYGVPRKRENSENKIHFQLCIFRINQGSGKCVLDDSTLFFRILSLSGHPTQPQTSFHRSTAL